MSGSRMVRWQGRNKLHNSCPCTPASAVVVRLYDLDESESLTVDEVTLAFKGALAGAAKLTGDAPPFDSALDAMARLVSGLVRYQAAVARITVMSSRC